MSSDILQDTAIIYSKLSNTCASTIQGLTTPYSSEMIMEPSTSRQSNGSSGNNATKNKSKSPKLYRRGRSQERYRRSSNASSGVMEHITSADSLSQQNQSQNRSQPNHVSNGNRPNKRRYSNPKQIKFSLNSNSFSTASLPVNFVKRVYTNSGFNRYQRRERSNSEVSMNRQFGIHMNRNNPNYSMILMKPGMSNDYVSREIMAYYQRNRQSNEKYKAKQILRQSLENTLKQSFPNHFINLHVVGSTTNANTPSDKSNSNSEKKQESDQNQAINVKLSDESTKIDPPTSNHLSNEEKIVVAAADSNTAISNDNSVDEITLKGIEKILQTKNFAQNIVLIPARVPVIKFNDIICNLNVTLNLNQEVSIRNTQLIRDYSKMDWRFPQLAMIMKQWARENRINSAVDKGISPYSWTLMVIHYLQVIEPPVLPCLQKIAPQRYDYGLTIEEDIARWRQSSIQWHSKNNSTLKQLLKGLFRYYGYVFDFDQHIISVREGKILNRIYRQASTHRSNQNLNGGVLSEDVNHQWNALMCVEEPFNKTNTTRSVHDREVFERIKELFRMSSNALKGNRISLFNIIVDDLDFPIKY
ncbi:hypothetical protein SSS_08792 [Sarcoptes scabiei]|nr:hypothetical protein SSS_08792 [Sarcoptes scabiei]